MHPGEDEQPTALDRRAERAARDREQATTPGARRRATARMVGSGGASLAEVALRSYLVQSTPFFAVIVGVAAGFGATGTGRVVGIVVAVAVFAFMLWVAWRRRGPLEQYGAVVFAVAVLAVTLALVIVR